MKTEKMLIAVLENKEYYYYKMLEQCEEFGSEYQRFLTAWLELNAVIDMLENTSVLEAAYKRIGGAEND